MDKILILLVPNRKQILKKWNDSGLFFISYKRYIFIGSLQSSIRSQSAPFTKNDFK